MIQQALYGASCFLVGFGAGIRLAIYAHDRDGRRGQAS